MPDDDGDGDAYPTCRDLCVGFDDDLDSDGDGTPDGCDPDGLACDDADDCDDELDCTVETCEDGFCVQRPGDTLCPWPAESTLSAQNLTHLDAPDAPEESDLRRNLSGAVWNPSTRSLWVARNGGPEMIWELREGADGELAVEERWVGADGLEFGDLEALSFGDFGESRTLFLLDESQSLIREWDLDADVETRVWDLTADMPAPTTFRGPEGLTFVPDRFLAAQGFRSVDGEVGGSRYGTGGLFFVGHQEGGLIYVFDLDRNSDRYSFLGRFYTGLSETAGLEFDASTGILWIFHGGNPMSLEAARVSWSAVTDENDRTRDTFDSVVRYEGPDVPIGASTNLEGVAMTPRSDCVDGARSVFMTTDDGGDWSLIRYRRFPCR